MLSYCNKICTKKGAQKDIKKNIHSNKIKIELVKNLVNVGSVRSFTSF